MSVIGELEAVIAARKGQMRDAGASASYTVRLLSDPAYAAQKVGEEAVEVVVASLAQSADRLTSESADLVYHLLVLLAAHDVSWAAVEEELKKRRK